MPAQTTENSLDIQYASPWVVYMVRCCDNSLYTGVTTDLTRRLDEHNAPKKGARYTRSRQPVTLVYQESASSRSAALAREYQLKRLSKSRKEFLIHSATHESTIMESSTDSSTQHDLTA